MTTAYGISTSKGSVSYDNYVNAAITGPLSTNNYPYAMPYHSYGVLTGLRPTPPQFYPSQSPPYAEENTICRAQYRRATAYNPLQLFKQTILGKQTNSTMYYNNTTGIRSPVSTHMNYIPPPQSSQYIDILKSRAVGKSAYKVGLPLSAPISTKSYAPSNTRSFIKRARSGGCVAPKKKGAIENYSLRNGQVCAWGALPRQNY